MTYNCAPFSAPPAAFFVGGDKQTAAELDKGNYGDSAFNQVGRDSWIAPSQNYI